MEDPVSLPHPQRFDDPPPRVTARTLIVLHFRAEHDNGAGGPQVNVGIDRGVLADQCLTVRAGWHLNNVNIVALIYDLACRQSSTRRGKDLIPSLFPWGQPGPPANPRCWAAIRDPECPRRSRAREQYSLPPAH